MFGLARIAAVNCRYGEVTVQLGFAAHDRAPGKPAAQQFAPLFLTIIKSLAWAARATPHSSFNSCHGSICRPFAIRAMLSVDAFTSSAAGLPSRLLEPDQFAGIDAQGRRAVPAP
jgi:hypothetical protein